MQIFREIEDPDGVARAHMSQGKLFLAINALAEAKIEFENGLDLALDLDDHAVITVKLVSHY